MVRGVAMARRWPWRFVSRLPNQFPGEHHRRPIFPSPQSARSSSPFSGIRFISDIPRFQSPSNVGHRAFLHTSSPLLRLGFSTAAPHKVEHSENRGSEENQSEEGSGWSTQEMLTWPNTISLSRLVLGPVLAWTIVQGYSGVAFCGMVFGGFTDWLDGYVARRTGVRSVLGSYLDPLADKVLVASVALSMTFADLLHPGLVTLMVSRDAVLVAGALYYRAQSLNWKWNGWGDFFKINAGGAPKLQPIMISKVNTVLQLALISAALLEPSYPELHSSVSFLSWSVAGTTVGSSLWYGVLYYRKPDAILKLNKVVAEKIQSVEATIRKKRKA